MGLLVASLSTTSLYAQANNDSLKAIIIETDPTTYFLKGYSVNVGYAFQ